MRHRSYPQTPLGAILQAQVERAEERARNPQPANVERTDLRTGEVRLVTQGAAYAELFYSWWQATRGTSMGDVLDELLNEGTTVASTRAIYRRAQAALEARAA